MARTGRLAEATRAAAGWMQPHGRRNRMHRTLSVRILIAVLLLAGIGWAAVTVGRPFHRDYMAGQALKPLIAEGRRLVPVREHAHMRGEAWRDYWCFSDGQCFYAVDAFRRAYFSYNDLEDDALLAELRERGGLP
jgi:hypothetical protein